MNNKRKIVIGLLAVICAAAVGFTAVLMYKEHKKSQIRMPGGSSMSMDAQVTRSAGDVMYNGQDYELNTAIKTVLFLGIDKKEQVKVLENAGRGGQSDTIILLILDTEKKETTLLEISRDTMTDIDLYDISGKYLTTEKAQLATQYAYGDGERKSCRMSKKTVSELLYGIAVDSCIALNIDGISAVADAMGGVTLTIPEDYTAIDPAYQKGAVVTLKGDRAERYVRYRDTEETGSNVQRMERQTQFLKAMASGMKGAAAKDSGFYNQLLTSAKPYMVSDMDAESIQALSEYEMNDEVLQVPGQEKAGAEHDEFYADDEKLYELILKLFYKSVDP